MAGRFSVEAVFKAIDRVTAPVSRMQNRVGKFTRSANKNFKKLNRTTDKFAAGLKRTAVAATAAALIITAGFGNVVAAGAGFEQAITNVGAVSLKTRAEIAPLEQMALQLGKTTKFTATQAANAMEILAKSGFETQDILKATPAVLSAAAASGLEIAEVADHVSNALKGMGLETKDAAMVSDVLTLASSKTNSTIGSLGESLRNVATTAKRLKIPFKDVVASVALLQDAGLDASVAGSATNVMLTKMAAPTVGLQKKMRRLGISFQDANKNMLTLPKVLSQLSKGTGKIQGNMGKVAFLAELVGLRGQKAAGQLTDLFESGRFTKLSKELDDFNGKAEAMAAIRMNTFEGSLLLLASAVDAVKVKMFGMSRGPLKEIVDGLTKWVGKNEELIASKIGGFFQDMIFNFIEIIEIIKKIGIGIAVFIALTTILKTLALVIAIVNGLMLMNPAALMVIGILALVAAIAAAVYWWDELKASLNDPVKTEFITDPDKFKAANLSPAIAAARVVAAAGPKLMDVMGRNFDKIKDFDNTVKSFLGIGDEDEQGAGAGSQMVSPQERIARSIEEKQTTNTTEVTLRAAEGTSAEVTGGTLGNGLKLQETGAF